MIIDTISAKELRDLGYEIPDSIPNCATIPRNSIGIKISPSVTEQDIVANKLSMEFSLSFSEPFTWYSATIDM